MAPKTSLPLQFVEEKDAGVYNCENGPFTSSITLTLTAGIDFLVKPNDISILQGRRIKLLYAAKTDSDLLLHGSWKFRPKRIEYAPKTLTGKYELDVKAGTLTSSIDILAEGNQQDGEYEFTVVARKVMRISLHSPLADNVKPFSKSALN